MFTPRGLPNARLNVELTSTEYRYYYDVIRVHCESGANLLVPIHGYPVAGDVQIPANIDLGVCPLNETKVCEQHFILSQL